MCKLYYFPRCNSVLQIAYPHTLHFIPHIFHTLTCYQCCWCWGGIASSWSAQEGGCSCLSASEYISWCRGVHFSTPWPPNLSLRNWKVWKVRRICTRWNWKVKKYDSQENCNLTLRNWKVWKVRGICMRWNWKVKKYDSQENWSIRNLFEREFTVSYEFINVGTQDDNVSADLLFHGARLEEVRGTSPERGCCFLLNLDSLLEHHF